MKIIQGMGREGAVGGMSLWGGGGKYFFSGLKFQVSE